MTQRKPGRGRHLQAAPGQGGFWLDGAVARGLGADGGFPGSKRYGMSVSKILAGWNIVDTYSNRPNAYQDMDGANLSN